MGDITVLVFNPFYNEFQMWGSPSEELDAVPYGDFNAGDNEPPAGSVHEFSTTLYVSSRAFYHFSNYTLPPDPYQESWKRIPKRFQGNHVYPVLCYKHDGAEWRLWGCDTEDLSDANKSIIPAPDLQGNINWKKIRPIPAMFCSDPACRYYWTSYGWVRVCT
ncbi:hypothetical protein ACFLZM_03095 [Thermodesulfobacteriota bacterium]